MLKATEPAPRGIQRTLLRVPQFAAKHHGFSVGTLRWWLYFRESNGLSRAVVKVGRSLYIDEEKFFQWIDNQQTLDTQDMQDSDHLKNNLKSRGRERTNKLVITRKRR